MTSPTPLRDRVAWLHRDIASRVREASSLELEVALLTAVAGIAQALGQTNAQAADTILSQIDDILGAQS